MHANFAIWIRSISTEQIAAELPGYIPSPCEIIYQRWYKQLEVCTLCGDADPCRVCRELHSKGSSWSCKLNGSGSEAIFELHIQPYRQPCGFESRPKLPTLYNGRTDSRIFRLKCSWCSSRHATYFSFIVIRQHCMRCIEKLNVYTFQCVQRLWLLCRMRQCLLH